MREHQRRTMAAHDDDATGRTAVSLGHIPRTETPLALAELHRALRTDAPVAVWLFPSWPTDLLRRTFEGAGFAIDELETRDAKNDEIQIIVHARRQWSLPDFVGPDMKLLICGLNPSPSSADHGVGYFKAGNRFWPAARQARLVSRDRDPRHALEQHGIGMTDLVKRPTRRADELSTDDYRAGLERVSKLVEWLQPAAVCMVGLAGWRAAVDRTAERGWQPEPLGGRPVYLMPSTSGLNAHDTVDTLADHLRNTVQARTLD